MAARRSFLALLIGTALCVGSVSTAQTPAPVGAPPATPPPRTEEPKHFYHRGGPEGDAMRDRAMHELQKLSPEQRANLWKAVWAVINLPPEKRQALLGLEEERRKFAREEIDRAMSDSGLQLDEEKRKMFVKRYFEERRAIEEKLRKESDEKRRELLGEMRLRLKKEFETAAVKPAPAAGAK